MAVTIRQTEDAPAAFPDPPSGLSDAAAALDPAVIWRRIEAWVAWRWTERGVIWTVEGAGDWTPPLSPAVIVSAELWSGAAYAGLTLPDGPFGFDLADCGLYRIVATVGGGIVPEDVSEAFRRLAEYSAGIGAYSMFDGRAGASTTDVKIGDNIAQHFERAPTWAARALINSGAADLLRRYRGAP